ncbi:MAG TPA: hypothetical protein VFR44_05390 [Actinomycetota bacterium]|nr:hypothetical protein [Actinomycetota bacterium]
MGKVRGFGRKRPASRVSTRGGGICDERCWEQAVRQRQFDRRLSTAGSVRLV